MSTSSQSRDTGTEHRLSPRARARALAAARAEGVDTGVWLGRLIRRIAMPPAPARAVAGPDDVGPAPPVDDSPPDGAALVAGLSAEAATAEPVMVPVAGIVAGPLGDDLRPDEREIRAIRAAHQATGVFPSLVLRPAGNTAHAVVLGAQRLIAARRAGLSAVPAIIRDIGDRDTLICALREARRGRGPGPMVQAACFRRLTGEFGLDADDIARALGERPAKVREILRLATLPRAVRRMISDGQLSHLHGLALLLAPDPEPIAWRAAGERLDIYQTEQLVRNALREARRADRPAGGAG